VALKPAGTAVMECRLQDGRKRLQFCASLFVCLSSHHTANIPEKLRMHTSGVQYWSDCEVPDENTPAMDLVHMNVVVKLCRLVVDLVIGARCRRRGCSPGVTHATRGQLWSIQILVPLKTTHVSDIRCPQTAQG